MGTKLKILFLWFCFFMALFLCSCFLVLVSLFLFLRVFMSVATCGSVQKKYSFCHLKLLPRACSRQISLSFLATNGIDWHHCKAWAMLIWACFFFCSSLCHNAGGYLTRICLFYVHRQNQICITSFAFVIANEIMSNMVKRRRAVILTDFYKKNCCINEPN